jgi:hypothetical protein
VEDTGWLTENAVAMAVAWPVIITVLTLPLAVRAFHNLSR